MPVHILHGLKTSVITTRLYAFVSFLHFLGAQSCGIYDLFSHKYGPVFAVLAIAGIDEDRIGIL